MDRQLCPLCASSSLAPYYKDNKRSYLGCAHCGLVSVPPRQHLSVEDEKAVYDLHQNAPDDIYYRRFLSRLTEPLLARLSANSQGLDFGCGPGPTLSVMMIEKGHKMALYDIYYHHRPEVLLAEAQYDFVTSTEVVEHLANPRQELDRLWSLIRPGGYLGLMTKLVTNHQSFACWHYKNDPTHINFFAKGSFVYLGHTWGSAPEFIGSDVIIFRK